MSTGPVWSTGVYLPPVLVCLLALFGLLGYICHQYWYVYWPCLVYWGISATSTGMSAGPVWSTGVYLPPVLVCLLALSGLLGYICHQYWYVCWPCLVYWAISATSTGMSAGPVWSTGLYLP